MTGEKKAEWVSTLYPEIRVVLKSIVNMSNLALNAPGAAAPLTYLQTIRSSSLSLLKRIDNAEGRSSIAGGPIALENVEFTLADIFEDLQSQIARSVEDKGLALTFHIPQEVPQTLFGDPVRLGQVLLNLTGNAIKFTHSGEIAVSVQKTEQLGDRVTLAFSVRDTGVGLTEEQLGTLFRATSADDTGAQHRLIGLNIVRDLVEKMDGTITVKSEPGTGSDFRFTAVFGRAERPAQTTPPPLPVFNGMNVLVVDDNKTMRMMLRLMLESLSFKVTAVSSGAEAIAEVERTDGSAPYELVFMDWMMPGMDGLEAARRIIHHKTLSWHPVIFMISAYGRNDIRIAAKQIGVEGFLEKPVNRSILQNALTGLFSIKQDLSTAEKHPESPMD